jgi:hypothetical protein
MIIIRIIPLEVDIEDSSWIPQTLQKRTLSSFATSKATNPATQLHIPEDLNPERNHYKNTECRTG